MISKLRISSGQAMLATSTVGRGDPVAFLHANVCDSRMWQHQLRGVGASQQAIAYDRRGFGETHAAQEDHSAVADLIAVLDAVAGSRPAILVGCSQGGKVAIDAALQFPSRVRALVLIAPSVGGAPAPVNPPEITELLVQQQAAEAAGDPDQIGAIKACLWLDGPLAPEGRVTGQARRLFHDMSAIALRSAPVGAGLDVAPAYDRLGEIAVPALLIWGDLDFPHIQARCREIAAVMPNASGCRLSDVAHLPSLERPAEVTRLVIEFVSGVPA